MVAERPSIDLYLIGGSYTNQDVSLDGDGHDVQVAFGGYFKTRPSAEGEGASLKGQIIDMWGPAVIEGQMSDERLDFVKRYVDSAGNTTRDEVGYQLRPNGESHLGTYTIHEDLYKGSVIAKVTRVSEDAYDMLMGPIRTE
ncbi:MAG: hypothetical protein KBC15_03310 [Candidatus Levybacteria bacterium]|nr:hypothetical protein [Candidatus Levybacteria bacterium]